MHLSLHMQSQKIHLKGKHSNDAYALVDNDDFVRVSEYTWYLKKDGRVMRAESASSGGSTLLSRFILDAPKFLEVDHSNHDQLDNRRVNLRLCTRAQNEANKGPGRSNKSGLKGVDFHKSSGKWRASMKHNLKRIHIGLYEDKVSAARAYDKEASRLHGEFAWLNKV